MPPLLSSCNLIVFHDPSLYYCPFAPHFKYTLDIMCQCVHTCFRCVMPCSACPSQLQSSHLICWWGEGDSWKKIGGVIFFLPSRGGWFFFSTPWGVKVFFMLPPKCSEHPPMGILNDCSLMNGCLICQGEGWSCYFTIKWGEGLFLPSKVGGGVRLKVFFDVATKFSVPPLAY